VTTPEYGEDGLFQNMLRLLRMPNLDGAAAEPITARRVINPGVSRSSTA
jgi:hypothetical protein